MGQLTQTTTELQAIVDNSDAANVGKTSLTDGSDTTAVAFKKSGFYSLQGSSSNAPSTDRAVLISAIRDTAATGEIRYGQIAITESNGLWWNRDDGGSLGTWYAAVSTTGTQTLTNKTLTSPVLTTPQINDSAADHQYIFAGSNLVADRTVTLPLLASDDTFVFEAHTQTLTNKTLTSPVFNTGVSGTAVLDADDFTGASATTLATSESIKAYVDSQVGTVDTLAEVLANGNATDGTNVVVTAGDVITTDTISETTAAAGVTIDSVLLKDDGVNATNLEVTNIKANDGTAAGSIADSTGVMTIASSVLTTADINAGTIDGTVIGSTTPAAITGTAITATGIMTATGTSVFASLDISGDVDIDGTTNLDVVDIDGAVDMATTLTVAGNVDFNGDLDVDGTTNLDVVDIDGAVNMATTALVTGVLTTTAATVFNGGFASNADSTLGTDKKVQFRDSAIYINSSVDGQLDIVADTEIQIAATTVDLNGNLDVSGTLGVTGVATLASLVATTADINAGTIDNTVIGGTTAAAGSFTTGSFSETTFVGLTARPAGVPATAGRLWAAQNETGNYGIASKASTTDSFTYIGNTGTKATLGQSYGSTGSYLPLVLQTSDIDRLTISAAGAATFSAGITATTGTFSSGQAILTVSSSTTSAGNAAEIKLIHAGNNTYEIKGGSDLIFSSDDGANERVRITNAGDVGIGSSPAGYRLLVESGANSATAYFSSTATPAYNPVAYNGGTARLAFVGGNATGATTGINFSHGGSVENYFGAVQEAGGAGAFVWQGYSGSVYAERMRLDASGNVGIGVVPSSWNSGYKAMQLLTGALYGTSSRDTNLGANVFVNAGGGYEYIQSSFATNYTQFNGVHSWYTAPSGTAGDAISFTQAMTLDASSNLLVGVTAVQSFSGPTAAQNFVTPLNGSWAAGFRNTTAVTPWGVAIDYTGANPNNTSSNFLYCSASGLKFSVMSNGGVQNYQANDANLSDRREKTNFSPAKSYLDAICAIPVQTFNYIDQNMEDDPSVTLGVVAQDVQTVAPELVMESNWGTEEDPKMRLSIYQTDLQYALMKCIQEQQATIESLEARIAALES
jgi:hypothetical protein